MIGPTNDRPLTGPRDFMHLSANLRKTLGGAFNLLQPHGASRKLPNHTTALRFVFHPRR